MTGREISLQILMEVNIEGAFSNIAINRQVEKNQAFQEENFIRELVYGVIENRKYIDYMIGKLSKRPIGKIHPPILEVLRLGVYQIVFMEKIPDRAAINETVNLAKKYGHQGTVKYVNGILRNLARKKDSLVLVDEKDPLSYLSIKYSYPKWMIKTWIKEYGYEFTEQLCIAGNMRPKLNIRVNTLRTSREDLYKSLNSYGYKLSKTPYAGDGLIIENPKRITSLGEYKEGHFIIQDESSMLVSQVMAPKEGSLVLDVCSAPGGKTTHLAQIMRNKGRIIARDIHGHKLQLVEDNYNRLGINIIETEIFDASSQDKNLVGKVDYCLVDAPCSGLGIIRRRPEIKWNRKEKDLKQLADLQWEILNKVKDYIKPNGKLVYSSCTISRDENENMVEKFLDKNKEFKLVGFEKKLNSKENVEAANKGFIQLFPHIHHTDGFFIANFNKIVN